jgi:3-oxoacid CoA-transferase
VIVTELAVFRFVEGELHLTELLGDATLADVEAVTAARYAVSLEESHVGG